MTAGRFSPTQYKTPAHEEGHAFHVLFRQVGENAAELLHTLHIRLRTSFCRRHRHYWHLRFALVFGGLAGLFVVLFVGLAVVILLITVAKIDAPWLSGFVIVPFILNAVAWIIPMKLVLA